MKNANRFALLAGLALAAAPVFAQEATSRTTASIGIDYSEGDFGTAQKTTTFSVPVAIKHESGRWTLKASIPYVWTEGAFSRESGVASDCLRRSGTEIDDECVAAAAAGGGAAGKQRQSGIGDLTLGAFYNLLESKSGLLVDAGVKAKLATADKAKTLITSGENDYSVQGDVVQAVGRSGSVFASLGWTKKGDTANLNFRDPIYGSLGASLGLADAGTVGASWDFREKTTANGDPASEVTLFYAARLGASRRLQVYVVQGLSDGSPDNGGGVVLSQQF